MNKEALIRQVWCAAFSIGLDKMIDAIEETPDHDGKGNTEIEVRLKEVDYITGRIRVTFDEVRFCRLPEILLERYGAQMIKVGMAIGRDRALCVAEIERASKDGKIRVAFENQP